MLAALAVGAALEGEEDDVGLGDSCEVVVDLALALREAQTGGSAVDLLYAKMQVVRPVLFTMCLDSHLVCMYTQNKLDERTWDMAGTVSFDWRVMTPERR